MRIPRLFDWAIATVILFSLITLLAPQQVLVSLYKLSLVSTAGVVGYWLDRSLFPYARPDSFISDDGEVDFRWSDVTGPESMPWDAGDTAVAMLFALAMLRRAVIVGCAMLAMGLGA